MEIHFLALLGKLALTLIYLALTIATIPFALSACEDLETIYARIAVRLASAGFALGLTLITVALWTGHLTLRDKPLDFCDDPVDIHYVIP